MRTRIPLGSGAKTALLVSGMLMVSTGAVLVIASTLLRQETSLLLQQMSADSASALAQQTRETLENIADKGSILGRSMIGSARSRRTSAYGEFFQRDRDFLAVYALSVGDENHVEEVARSVSDEMKLREDGSGDRTLQAVVENPEISWESVFKAGSSQIALLKLPDGTPSMVVVIPLDRQGSHFNYALGIVIRQSRVMRMFARLDQSTAYLVDRRGRLLAHPEEPRALLQEDLSALAVVRHFLSGKSSRGELEYTLPSGQSLWGAFESVGFAGLGVISEVPKDPVIEAVSTLRYRVLFVLLAMLSLNIALTTLARVTASPQPRLKVSPPPFKGNRREWYVKLGSEVLGPFQNFEIATGMEHGDFGQDLLIAPTAKGPWYEAQQELEPKFTLGRVA